MTAKSIVRDMAYVPPELHDERLLLYLEAFEARIRADERVKATAEAYERIAETMVPRHGGNS